MANINRNLASVGQNEVPEQDAAAPVQLELEPQSETVQPGLWSQHVKLARKKTMMGSRPDSDSGSDDETDARAPVIAQTFMTRRWVINAECRRVTVTVMDGDDALLRTSLVNLTLQAFNDKIHQSKVVYSFRLRDIIGCLLYTSPSPRDRG